jgi:hypothetical protein
MLNQIDSPIKVRRINTRTGATERLRLSQPDPGEQRDLAGGARSLIDGAVTKTAFTYSVPLTGRGANLTKAARRERRTRLPIHVDGVRGEGGIRTLEGALHPLPA